ncbi:hypothetical protein IFR04_001691 [Cadophora malorum]|uniref:Uncharacterized protein n=1 Tax=Cadophora malorum TaxID=108018 RepID=A0A8H8BVE9_9HELO|nr:hypothetical protein IFR04_001691 [Cadophora malorum]
MAVDRLENLFLEILRTRQELFKWDIPNSADRQCDIDPQVHRNTEHIMWDVNEPNLTPVSFKDYTPIEAGDSDHDSDSDDDDHHDDSDSAESADETCPDDTDEANNGQDQQDEDAVEDSVGEASSERHGSVDDDGDSDEASMIDGVSDNGEDEQDQVHDESAPLPIYGGDASETHAAGEDSDADDLQVSGNDGESL